VLIGFDFTTSHTNPTQAVLDKLQQKDTTEFREDAIDRIHSVCRGRGRENMRSDVASKRDLTGHSALSQLHETGDKEEAGVEVGGKLTARMAPETF